METIEMTLRASGVWERETLIQRIMRFFRVAPIVAIRAFAMRWAHRAAYWQRKAPLIAHVSVSLTTLAVSAERIRSGVATEHVVRTANAAALRIRCAADFRTRTRSGVASYRRRPNESKDLRDAFASSTVGGAS